MEKKKIKTKYSRKIAFIIEFFIWILILTLFFFIYFNYKKYVRHNYSRYQLFMQDVDGIIVGSPVKMLGITIGYVKNLKPVNDNVFVDFIITEKGIKIPKGSLLTVEFSGLASSKSIEIYPPKSANISETQNIIVQQPRRINAAVGLLNEMFNKISEIIFKFTRFSNSLSESLENEYKNNKKVSDKKKEKMNIDFKKMNDELININKLIDNQQNNIDNRLKREKQ